MLEYDSHDNNSNNNNNDNNNILTLVKIKIITMIKDKLQAAHIFIKLLKLTSSFSSSSISSASTKIILF